MPGNSASNLSARSHSFTSKRIPQLRTERKGRPEPSPIHQSRLATPTGTLARPTPSWDSNVPYGFSTASCQTIVRVSSQEPRLVRVRTGYTLRRSALVPGFCFGLGESESGSWMRSGTFSCGGIIEKQETCAASTTTCYSGKVPSCRNQWTVRSGTVAWTSCPESTWLSHWIFHDGYPRCLQRA